VLLFPGRTEYVEKYGPAAQDLAQRGFATISVDWRGQGLADRMLGDPRVGHVDEFQNYQKDVAVVIEAARKLDLPRPYFLLAHSMGGAIGLRALHENLPVQAAAFSAPMWGIQLKPHLRPAAWLLGRVMPAIGHGGTLAPGTKLEPYVLSDPYVDNKLTTDERMFDMMRSHLNAHPDLGLGGPSYTWLHEALMECATLSELPSPDLPCLSFHGHNERIVDVNRIDERMRRWPGSRLERVDGEHEVLMETPSVRAHLYDTIAGHFATAA